MSPNYFECDITIEMESGLHARPAGVLVKIASQYKSKIEIEKSGSRKNAKSIMSLMSLGVVHGDKIRLIFEGDDAADAKIKICDLFEKRFQIEL